MHPNTFVCLVRWISHLPYVMPICNLSFSQTADPLPTSGSCESSELELAHLQDVLEDVTPVVCMPILRNICSAVGVLDNLRASRRLLIGCNKVVTKLSRTPSCNCYGGLLAPTSLLVVSWSWLIRRLCLKTSRRSFVCLFSERFV